jgi:predicted enzyme related to lactoylglutathione lyase
MNTERKVVHTRHVLAVKDLDIASAYFIDKLGFDRDFSAPGWMFLSFGIFKVMLGECSDEMTAEATGNHSWFAHCLVENVDEVYDELVERGAKVLTPIGTRPWNIRDFTIVTPDGHRIMFGQSVE